MNFFNNTVVINNQFTNTNKIDTRIQNTMYPGMLSDADGIDLKIELYRMLFGTDSKHPLGHWVVVRTFDDLERSKYFNNYSKEGIMGPPKIFKDYLVLSRRVPLRFARGTTEIEKVADIINDGFIYYFENTVDVKAGSQIYEIDQPNSDVKPIIYKLIDKYDVTKIQDFRLENGKTQFHAAICENVQVTL